MKKTTNGIKKLKGTARPCRTDAEIEVANLDALPPCPNFVSQTGQEIYIQLGEMLMNRNIINASNINAWVMFCRYYSMWYDYHMNTRTIEEMVTSQVNKGGGVYTTVAAEWRIAEDAGDKARKLMGEFGLTPVALSKIANILASNKPKDPYESYLSGR